MRTDDNKSALPGRPLVFYGVIGIVGLSVLLAAGAAGGFSSPYSPGTDQAQYLGIAANLAHGFGYKDPVGAWSNLPAYDRMPVWPAILAVGLTIAPHAVPEAVSRAANIICLVLAGISFGALCRRLGIRPVLSLAAGLSVVFSPVLVYYGLQGMSEISFVFIIGTALALAFSSSRHIYAAALLAGLGPLVRTNFILVCLLAIGLALLVPSTRRALLEWKFSRVIFVCALMILPSGLWVIRNYNVSGRFPVLSSLEGEALYGSNNDTTANDLKKWGYWVIPDEIPGETPKVELSTRFAGPLGLSDYYHRKAMLWIRSHGPEIPRLIVGKLVRAEVPVPWADSPSLSEFAAFSSRFVVQALFIVLLPFWWPRMNRPYLTILASMAIGHLITTVVFYGSARFTYCFLEVFFIPCIFFGMEQWLTLRSRESPAIAVRFQRRAG